MKPSNAAIITALVTIFLIQQPPALTKAQPLIEEHHAEMFAKADTLSTLTKVTSVVGLVSRLHAVDNDADSLYTNTVLHLKTLEEQQKELEYQAILIKELSKN